MKTKAKDLTDRGVLRQSNFELLRILAMVIIIAHHFAFHSGFEFPNDRLSINRLWIQFILIGGKIGVNIFILISGYFLVLAKQRKTSKVLKLWGQLFFYSIIIYIVFVVSGEVAFDIKGLIKSLAPITFCQWWFASTYFVLYLLTPFINAVY